MEEPKQISICLMGNAKVGKSSLVLRMMNDDNSTIDDDYDPTVEDQYKYEDTIKGQQYNIILTDTGDGLTHSALYPNWVKNANCFILMYSLTDRQSYNSIRKSYYDYIRRFKPTVDIILLGNKTDLDAVREVKTKEGVNLAYSLKIPFAEVSIKETKNLKEIVFDLISKTQEEMNSYSYCSIV